MSIVRIDVITPTAPITVADYQAQNDQIGVRVLNSYQKYPIDGTDILKGTVLNAGGTQYIADADTAITGTPSPYVLFTPAGGGATLTPSYRSTLSGVTWNSTYNHYRNESGYLVLTGAERVWNTNRDELSIAEGVALVGDFGTLNSTDLNLASGVDLTITDGNTILNSSSDRAVTINSTNTGTAITDGAINITAVSDYGSAKSIIVHRQDANQLVVNEDGESLAFRVEGTGTANLFVTDADNDTVGIGGTLMLADNVRYDVTSKSRRIESPGSQNDVFNELDPYIPNRDDRMLLSGAVFDGSTVYIVSYAQRSASSQIILYGMTLTGNSSSAQANEGNTSTLNKTIAI